MLEHCTILVKEELLLFFLFAWWSVSYRQIHL
jgi:hypothetical protein